LLTIGGVKGGTEATFLKDLEQSWRLYQLQALVFNASLNFNDHVRHKVRGDVLEFIQQFHPRRIWLYVKHARWMFSDEYAMLQDVYIGEAPIFDAKTKALVRPGIEDEVVKGELLYRSPVSPNWNNTLTPRLSKPSGQSWTFIAPHFRSWSARYLPSLVAFSCMMGVGRKRHGRGCKAQPHATNV
jgi:hypothetical protein